MSQDSGGELAPERSYGRNTPRARAYVDAIAQLLEDLPPGDIAARTRAVVEAHDRWRNEQAISLNAAENVLSEEARKLLDSDLATRVTEGFPGDKDFPAHRQNRFVDEIEASIIFMLKRMFACKHVEWRPVSTSMANATVFFALTDPGDTILVQSEANGGNYSYNPDGPPAPARLNVKPLSFLGDSFEVDLERAVREIEAERPRMVVVGGSNVLFPYPVRELRAAVDRVGATLVYDAAHTALYLANGMFQDPLSEGAHILTFSNHKLLSGPVGGIIATNDDDIAARILPYSFPKLIQTRDQNKFAASAHALAEMLEFGASYARQTVVNARALAEALEGEGFEVLFRDRRYTETHQIFALIDDADGDVFEDLCQQANLLVSRAQRMGARAQAAVRLTTQEITRRGMTEAQMPILAQWLRRVIRDRENPARIRSEIEGLLTGFRTIRFSFDGASARGAG